MRENMIEDVVEACERGSRCHGGPGKGLRYHKYSSTGFKH